MPPIDIFDNKKHVLCDSYIVEFVNNATEIIMRGENMVVGVLMLLRYLSFCCKF